MATVKVLTVDLGDPDYGKSFAIGCGACVGTNYFAVAIGVCAGVTGCFGNAVGYNAHAATNGVALGGGASACGDGSVAVGFSSQALNSGVAIGCGASANEKSVALGCGAVACGARSVAVGVGANAACSGNVAIGYHAATNSCLSVAISDGVHQIAFNLCAFADHLVNVLGSENAVKTIIS